MCASVHAEASSAASEAVSLGPKLPSVAGLAVQDVLVTVGVGGVQHLVAHTLGRGGGRGGMLVRHMYFFFFFMMFIVCSTLLLKWRVLLQ